MKNGNCRGCKCEDCIHGCAYCCDCSRSEDADENSKDMYTEHCDEYEN